MRLLALYGHLGLRNLWRNRRRSLLTILAISFGLASLLVFLALKEGLHREMVRSAVELDLGGLQIHAAGYQPNLAGLLPVPEPQRLLETLRVQGLRRVAPRLKTFGLVLAGRKSASVLLAGVVPAAEQGLTIISRRLVAGDYLAAPGALVGEELARSLGVGVGDRLKLMAQGSPGRPVVRSLTVTGIYRTALASFDRSHIFLSLSELQEFLGVGQGAITEVAVGLPPDRAAATAARLGRLLSPDRYQVASWQQLAPDVVQLIELNDATMGVLILIVFTIVAMGIANTMTTVIYERFHELGILTAIGTSPGGIVAMVVMEAGLLGVAGSLVGSLAGGAACGYLHRYGIDLTALTSNNQYFATSHLLKAALTPGQFLAANLVTLATGVVAGFYPAIRAARLEPVEAILHV